MQNKVIFQQLSTKNGVKIIPSETEFNQPKFYFKAIDRKFPPPQKKKMYFGRLSKWPSLLLVLKASFVSKLCTLFLILW